MYEPSESPEIRKEESGVCCITSYVSKRKTCGYEFWGLVRFGGKLHHEKSCKRTNPPKRTHVSYVSKRNFLYNTPLITIKATETLNYSKSFSAAMVADGPFYGFPIFCLCAAVGRNHPQIELSSLQSPLVV